jgi:hypothetical protein
MGATATAIIAAAVVVSPPETAAPDWQGVWQGTVGTLPVRACLARRGETYSVGSYYYLRQLRPIPLRQVAQSRVWTEGEGSDAASLPTWRFHSIGPVLMGEWRSGARRLPFRLTRLPGLDSDDEPCGSRLFNIARLRPLRLTQTRAVIDGVGYTKLAGDAGPAFEEVELETFAVDGDDPATRRINQVLRRPIAGDPAASDWFGCVTSGMNAHGRDGDFSLTIAPTMITRRWLVASEASGTYCGGPHPNYATRSLTFDRATGAAVDLHGWLGPQAVQREADVTMLRPALRQVIMARSAQTETECRETIGETEFWDIGLAREGLRFTPDLPHVLTACEEATLVPWAALTLFLNAAGRAGAASLR